MILKTTALILSASAVALAATPTFSKDVAPILREELPKLPPAR